MRGGLTAPKQNEARVRRLVKSVQRMTGWSANTPTYTFKEPTDKAPNVLSRLVLPQLRHIVGAVVCGGPGAVKQVHLRKALSMGKRVRL